MELHVHSTACTACTHVYWVHINKITCLLRQTFYHCSNICECYNLSLLFNTRKGSWYILSPPPTFTQCTQWAPNGWHLWCHILRAPRPSRNLLVALAVSILMLHTQLASHICATVLAACALLPNRSLFRRCNDQASLPTSCIIHSSRQCSGMYICRCVSAGTGQQQCKSRHAGCMRYSVVYHVPVCSRYSAASGGDGDMMPHVEENGMSAQV